MNTKRIVLAGGSGFLGQILARHLRRSSHEVVILTRTPGPGTDGIREIGWDGQTLGPWAKQLDGSIAVVNLAGRSVDCRYNARNRKLIVDSRVNSTRVLGHAIQACKSPPAVWLNSSSATIYKHSFDRPMDEAGETGASPAAKDAFSIDVINAWERALHEASMPGTRKVAMRISMVLGNRGGVFPVLRGLTRLGLGGKMGSGAQFVSWIHELDFCRAVEWIMAKEELDGPVNIAAPNPLTNREIMATLRKGHRRTFWLTGY
jgi:uncharacterized protein (TIGR01777 family)